MNATSFRFTLEKGSKKYPCPGCHKRRLVRYLDREKGGYLPLQYGRCDRESKCGYHMNPYRDGFAKTVQDQERGFTQNKKVVFRPAFAASTAPGPVFFDFDTFRATLETDRYEHNVFIQNLLSRVPFPFDPVDIEKVISLYRLGTVSNGYMAGAITFPFIDKLGRVRTIQVKQFDRENHTTNTTFLHSIIEQYHSRRGEPLPGWLVSYLKQDRKVSCLFGEHLFSKYPQNPIALVEAPKTAIYGTLYFGFPDDGPGKLIWLAVYNKSSFSIEKLEVLQGRKVFVFPDLSHNGSTYQEWETKAQKVRGTSFIFSNLLERFASDQDRKIGADLADYLIKLDWRLFRFS